MRIQYASIGVSVGRICMLTKFFLQQRVIQLTILIAMWLLVVACSSSNTMGSTAAPTSVVVTSAHATFKHSPLGTVQLDWNRVNRGLTVHISLTGLAPKSVHPAHIHLGSCHSPGR